MTLYVFTEDENQTESLQGILAMAEDRAGEVNYQPSVGPAGAVDLPDDLYLEWVDFKTKHDQEKQQQETSDETTGKSAGRPSRRGQAAKE